MSQIVRSTVTGSSGDLKLREFQTRYDSDTTQDEMNISSLMVSVQSLIQTVRQMQLISSLMMNAIMV